MNWFYKKVDNMRPVFFKECAILVQTCNIIKVSYKLGKIKFSIKLKSSKHQKCKNNLRIKKTGI